MNAAAYVNDIKLFEMKDGKPELIAANKAFIEQVKNFEYNVEHDDAPDADEGAIYILQQRTRTRIFKPSYGRRTTPKNSW